MADIRTLANLQDALDREMGWRLKEIGAFGVASKANSQSARFFIRAGVALLYAHWEGFVKSASEYYLSFVESQGHTYQELRSCFAIFGLKAKLDLLSSSRRALANIAAFDFVAMELNQRARLTMSSAIDTESNLSSSVFSNIAASLALDVTQYATKFNLIDESLVARRNRIAHGEYIDLSGREFGELVDEVTTLMRGYKTDIENAASLKNYRRE